MSRSTETLLLLPDTIPLKMCETHERICTGVASWCPASVVTDERACDDGHVWFFCTHCSTAIFLKNNVSRRVKILWENLEKKEEGGRGGHKSWKQDKSKEQSGLEAARSHTGRNDWFQGKRSACVAAQHQRVEAPAKCIFFTHLKGRSATATASQHGAGFERTGLVQTVRGERPREFCPVQSAHSV